MTIQIEVFLKWNMKHEYSILTTDLKMLMKEQREREKMMC